MRAGSNGKRITKGVDDRVSYSDLEGKISKGKDVLFNKSNNTNVSKPLVRINVNSEKEKNSLEIKKNNLEKENTKLEIEKNDLEIKKNKFRKRKERPPKYVPVNDIGKLSRKRIICMVLTGIVSSAFLSGLVYGVYYNCIRYPSQMKEDVASSGLGGIDRWVNVIGTLSNDKIKKEIGKDSYLAKEVEYANGDEERIKFFKKIVNTVKYTPNKVEAKNIYGNPMISRKDDSIVLTDSLVNTIGEEVTLSYIDYNKVPLDENKIKSIIKSKSLTLGVGDYSNGLVDAFCEYINSIPSKDLPLVSVKHTPSLIQDGDIYRMTEEEDIYLDKVLFSSNEFYSLLDRFSEVAAKGMQNPKWVSWSKLPDKDKTATAEPVQILSNLEPTASWVEWSTKSEEEKKLISEPTKYKVSDVMSKSWCGAYYLLNEHKVLDSNGNEVSKPIVADVGDGTFKNPASINTGVVSTIFVSDLNGNKVAKPIKVKLIDYKVSQDAIDYFESKDLRNRGYDIKSDVQYISYTFEVTNLSNDVLTIYDNSALSDESANLSPRTGTVYGLQNSITLQPYETGVIESWGCSTELNKKYLIWGADFNRAAPVVWYRVLAGDLEDKSTDKGVHLNNKKDEE